MLDLRFEAAELTERELSLKREVREFAHEYLSRTDRRITLGMGDGSDPLFSRDLGCRGWIGMNLPVEFGGGGGTAVERLVVTEELLAAGAPVGYHWVADRQSGPSIAANGTESQKAEFLPRIARGELSFAIGMSEPGAGSDLAAVRTRADRVDGDSWRINGSKIWTSNARGATHMLCLFRTSQDKHGGLTQFIVDTSLDGIEIRPIRFLDGKESFFEVFFTDVIVPDSMRLGNVGDGWGQNRSELALERGGIDRWFSMIRLIDAWSKRVWTDQESEIADERIAQLTALAWSCRGLSLSIARAVDDGRQPVSEAALIKNYATKFEQLCVDEMHDQIMGDSRFAVDGELRSAVERAMVLAPSWTIRGGTNQILRRIVGKAISQSGK